MVKPETEKLLSKIALAVLRDWPDCTPRDVAAWLFHTFSPPPAHLAALASRPTFDECLQLVKQTIVTRERENLP